MEPGFEDLIERCVDGDEKSQIILYRRVFGRLMAMARRYHINRDDCTFHVNAAFLKILDNLDTFKRSGSFEAWCARIMSNVLIDEWRRSKQYIENHQLNQSTEQLSIMDEATYNSAQSELDAEALFAMLHQLPATTRHIFNLFAIEGYAHAEIAEMMDMSEGTSRWHVNEARTLLKKKIQTEMKIIPLRNAI